MGLAQKRVFSTKDGSGVSCKAPRDLLFLGRGGERRGKKYVGFLFPSPNNCLHMLVRPSSMRGGVPAYCPTVLHTYLVHRHPMSLCDVIRSLTAISVCTWVGFA